MYICKYMCVCAYIYVNMYLCNTSLNKFQA